MDSESEGLYEIIECLVGIADVGAGEFGIELLRIGEFNIEIDGIHCVHIHGVHIFHQDLCGIAHLDAAIKGLGIAHVNRIEVVSAVAYHGFVIDLVGLIVLENLQNFETVVLVEPHITGRYREYHQRE